MILGIVLCWLLLCFFWKELGFSKDAAFHLWHDPFILILAFPFFLIPVLSYFDGPQRLAKENRDRLLSLSLQRELNMKETRELMEGERTIKIFDLAVAVALILAFILLFAIIHYVAKMMGIPTFFS